MLNGNLIIQAVSGLKKAGSLIRSQGKDSLMNKVFWANVSLALLNVGCLLAFEPACAVLGPASAILGG